MSSSQLKSMEKLIITLAYLAVIIIWSTTPLTIKWSSEGVGYLPGLMFRMMIGACMSVLLVVVIYRKLSFSASSCKAYTAVALALYGGMIPVYWASQYISSGLISVIFGISPIVVGYLSYQFIQERSFSAMKVLGSLSGVIGLGVIFLEDMSLNSEYTYGILATLLAVLLHATSAIWVKGLKIEMPPLSLVSGGLLFTMPLFLLSFAFTKPEIPVEIPARTIWSILYLGVVGSILGFVCYYYLLKRLAASTVALITLITPVIALFIGKIFNNEAIGYAVFMGTLFVLLGLALYQWGDLLLEKVWRKRNFFCG